MSKATQLKFVKPTKDCRKQFIQGREVVRWGYFFDDSRTQHCVYAITVGGEAYKIPEQTLLAEQRPLRKPEDSCVQRASWGTSPARQRAINKLMAVCRADFEQTITTAKGSEMQNAELDMADQICQLRAALATAASMLEDVLDNGFPSKGRSQDDKESAEQWREDRYDAVKKAESVLEATKEYAGVISR
jgi:hypothetical protein